MQDEHVSETCPRLQAVNVASRQEGDKGGFGKGAIVGTEKPPRSAPYYGLPGAGLSLSHCCGREYPVFKEPLERNALIAGVLERQRHGRFLQERLGYLIRPGKEALHRHRRVVPVPVSTAFPAAGPPMCVQV